MKRGTKTFELALVLVVIAGYLALFAHHYSTFN